MQNLGAHLVEGRRQTDLDGSAKKEVHLTHILTDPEALGLMISRQRIAAWYARQGQCE